MSTHTVKISTEMRMALSVTASLMPGRRLRRMFSTKVVEGASSVAEAVDMMADSSAPKNATCSATGMRSSTSVGSSFCGSSLSSAPAASGMMSTAAATTNMGIKANSR